MSITGPLREIHRILDHAHESSIQVNDLYNLLSEPEDPSFKINHLLFRQEPPKSDLAFQIHDLSFSYPTNPTIEILTKFSLEIRKGEKVGIAGASGCGKSTLLMIILRLVHGYKGKISVMGQDLESLSQAEISNKIAYVPQKTYIFSGTIRDNIAYGNKNTRLTDSDIKESAKEACILGEIDSFLGGLGGIVTENGNNLSGGQKQRLAIARLILKRPEILILDEATSALDNTNEINIQNNLERLFNNKTSITVAHRLSTLKNCDRILVFGQGKIVQQGKFKELSNKKGLFKDFLEQKSSH